jgi:hypothetical protein
MTAPDITHRENDSRSAMSGSDDAVLGEWLRGSIRRVKSVVGIYIRMV